MKCNSSCAFGIHYDHRYIKRILNFVCLRNDDAWRMLLESSIFIWRFQREWEHIAGKFLPDASDAFEQIDLISFHSSPWNMTANGTRFNYEKWKCRGFMLHFADGVAHRRECWQNGKREWYIYRANLNSLIQLRVLCSIWAFC